jgi:hypothetical protein
MDNEEQIFKAFNCFIKIKNIKVCYNCYKKHYNELSEINSCKCFIKKINKKNKEYKNKLNKESNKESNKENINKINKEKKNKKNKKNKELNKDLNKENLNQINYKLAIKNRHSVYCGCSDKDCGLLSCGCIDMCRGRCGNKIWDDGY